LLIKFPKNLSSRHAQQYCHKRICGVFTVWTTRLPYHEVTIVRIRI
jgi:hypothetical protein